MRSVKRLAETFLCSLTLFGLLLINNGPAKASGLSHLETDLSCSTIYTVQLGDWLSKIGAHFGVSWQTLASVNNLPNPNLIWPGERLCIPSGSSSPPPPVPTNNAISPLEPCKSTDYWPGTIGSWVVPPGCFATIYYPNAANYPPKPGFGWCNWWPEETHPQENIFAVAHHAQPRIGAAVFFPPGDQGASPVGHWAGDILAISPNGFWLLISEMNDTWRGAGFGRINYRYIMNDGRISFIY